MPAKGTTPRHCVGERKEMVRGIAPRHCDVEQHKNDGEGAAPRHRAEQEEIMARGRALAVVLLNGKRRR
jgi:hypothetical protein